MAMYKMDKYQKYELIETEKCKTFLKYVVENDGEQIEMRFAAVRGAWAWPTDISPFYYCIVAQEWVDSDSYSTAEDPNLELICECTLPGLDLMDRFNRLSDDASLYLCDFRADLNPIHEPEMLAYYDYRSKRNFRYGRLSPAPYADSFRLGVELIKSLAKTSRIDVARETVIYNQLAKITENDLGDVDIKCRYFAIEALRHVVASFKRDPVVYLQPYTGTGFTPHPQAWMGA
jgi:hypothetical protein